MVKTIDIQINGMTFKALDKTSYRLSCRLELLYMEMLEDVDVEIEDVENFEPKSFRDLKGFNFQKKQEIMDLLLVEAVKFPPITTADLDDGESEYNDYFKELADLLMERYMEQFVEINSEKKKLTKSSD